MPVCIANRQRAARLPTARLRRAMEIALEATDHAGDELSVAFVRDPAIRILNRDWRAKDRPTDVLSFPQQAAPGQGPRVLGDVVVSVDTAVRQAREIDHALEDELLRLLVHGYLHLLGYDHERGAADARVMRREERRVLREIGRTPETARR